MKRAADTTRMPRYAHWETTGSFKIAAVGTSFYRSDIAFIAQNPDNSRALVICIAYLLPDNQNIHDPHTVRVVVEGRTVGHLSRDFAKRYRSYISDLPSHIQCISVTAAITNGLKTIDKAYEYTVEVDIPDSLKLHVLNEPLRDPPMRLSGYAPLRQCSDGSYLVKVWVPVSDHNELHKHRVVEEWTTDRWETVNFYAINRQGIGLGFKVYELQKREYAKLFKDGPTSGMLLLEGQNRFATLRIKAET